MSARRCRLRRDTGRRRHDHDHDHDHDHHHRRASLLITGEHGKPYVVEGSERSAVQGDDSSPAFDKRADSFSSRGVPGRVDIVSPTSGSSAGQRIASLLLAPAADSMAASSMNDTNNGTFVLNASENGQTQVYLVPAPASSSNSTSPSLSPKEVMVMLEMPMFEAESVSMSSYCATFNPKPSTPASLTAQSCDSESGTPNSQYSQLFAFNTATSVIRPLWFEDQSAASGDPTDTGASGSAPTNNTSIDPPTPSDASMMSVTNLMVEPNGDGPSGTASNATGTSSSTATLAPTPSSAASSYNNAESVMLVFTPDAPELQSFSEGSSPDASIRSSSPEATATSTASAQQSNASSSTMSNSVVNAAYATTTDTALPSASSSSASPSTTQTASMEGIADVSTSSSMTMSQSSMSPPSQSFSASVDSASSTSSGAVSTPTPSSTLGVQVVVEQAGASSSVASASSTGSSMPTMTPVSTSPYEWMFKSDA